MCNPCKESYNNAKGYATGKKDSRDSQGVIVCVTSSLLNLRTFWVSV